MERAPENYTRSGWIAAAALLGVLVAVSFIPPQSVGGVKFRRANILSDLVAFDDSAADTPSSAVFDEEEFHVDMAEVAERIETEVATPHVQTLFEWTIGRDTTLRPLFRPDTVLCPERRIVPIEEYDSVRTDGMRAFYDKLLADGRPVRIAVLGDSFIEGDILTADLRERMQETFGGGGPGFAPVASPLSYFRRTVKTVSKGWTAYNIMQRKKTPESLRQKFYVSGWVCQAGPGASTRWEPTAYRRKLDDCTCGRIFFLSPDSSRVEVTVNDTLRQEFAVAGDPSVRQIAVTAPRIGSLGFRVVRGHERFVGYGAVMEGEGVSVDNYSIRSNNGQAMFWTDPSVDAQIDAMLDYDLVILQYGLNIMQQGVYNYTNYAAKIEKMVGFVRECFPGAAVLVMGVSDRSVRSDTDFERMDAVPHMISYQRLAARRSQAAFWPTSDAMRALGGMERFVRNGWAGKDYTHINYAGGTRIAHALFDALNHRACTLRRSHRQRQPEVPVMDSLQHERIRRQLLYRPRPIDPSAP